MSLGLVVPAVAAACFTWRSVSALQRQTYTAIAVLATVGTPSAGPYSGWRRSRKCELLANLTCPIPRMVTPVIMRKRVCRSGSIPSIPPTPPEHAPGSLPSSPAGGIGTVPDRPKRPAELTPPPQMPPTNVHSIRESAAPPPIARSSNRQANSPPRPRPKHPTRRTTRKRLPPDPPAAPEPCPPRPVLVLTLRAFNQLTAAPVVRPITPSPASPTRPIRGKPARQRRADQRRGPLRPPARHRPAPDRRVRAGADNGRHPAPGSALFGSRGRA